MRKRCRILHPDQIEFELSYLVPALGAPTVTIDEARERIAAAAAEESPAPDDAILAEEDISIIGATVAAVDDADEVSFISIDEVVPVFQASEPWLAPEKFKLPVEQAERIQANYDASGILKALQDSGKEPSAKEKQVLALYTGWSGMSVGYSERLPGGEKFPNSSLNQDFSPAVQATILRMIERNAPNGANVLFANCDTPALPAMAGASFTRHGRIGFHSRDKEAGLIAKLLMPEARLYEGDFTNTNIPDEYFHMGFLGSNWGVSSYGSGTAHKGVVSIGEAMKMDFCLKPGAISLMNFPFASLSGFYSKEVARQQLLAEDLDFRVSLHGTREFAKTSRYNTYSPKAEQEVFVVVKRMDKDPVPSIFSNSGVASKHSPGSWPGWADPAKNFDLADAEAIHSLVHHLPDTIFSTSYVMPASVVADASTVPLEDVPEIPYGGFKLLEDGTILTNRDGSVRPVPFTSETEKTRLTQLIVIQETAKLAFEQRQGDDSVLFAETQKKLASLCDEHTKIFYSLDNELGLLHLVRSSDSGALISLARDFAASKDDAANEDSIFTCAHSPIAHLGKPKTLEEAYRRSLRMTGRVDVAHIGALAGLPEAEHEKIPAALGDLVFLDVENHEYVPAELYLSGDVIGKLEAAGKAAQYDKAFTRNVNALQEIAPEPLKCEDVSLNRCAPWMDMDMLRDFSESIFEEAGLQIDRFDGKWSVKITKKNSYGSNVKASATDIYATKERSGVEILRMVLKGSPSEFDPANLKIPDDGKGDPIEGAELEAFYKHKREEYALIKTKFAAINSSFQVWAKQEPARMVRIQTAYNRALNRYLPYTPSVDSLSLKGLNPAFKPDPHQYVAVAKGANMDSILLNHFTGAGKSFVLGGIANERLTRGQNHKIALVLPRATLTQFAAECSRLFPALPVHIVGPQDITGESPGIAYQRAVKATNCLTVFTYETFLDVPLSKKDQLSELAKQRKAAQTRLMTSTVNATKDSATKRIEALTKEIAALAAKEQSMPVNITDAGFDGIMADEAHLLRNLKANGPGFEAANGNDRTADFFEKVQQLRSRNPRLFLGFGTGTVGGRKGSDIYNLMRYMAPEQLKSAGAHTLGDFLNIFAVRDLMSKVDIKGEIKNYYGYELVPSRALANMLNSFTDTVYEDDVERVKKSRPNYRNGTKDRITCPQCPAQEAIYGDILDAINKKKGAKLTGDHILTLYQKAIRAAIDPRLVDKSAAMPTDGKIAQSVAKAVEVYESSRSVRGTQLVFCDMYSRRPDSTDPTDKGFNIYHEYRDALIASGVPKKEIAIIGEVTDAKKDSTYEDFRAGKIRFILGSRALVGTGMNIQNRIVADHYLDIPWNPEQQMQAEGRGRRAGNMNQFLDSFHFLTDRSPEAIVSSRMEAKIRATSAIFRLTAREASYKQVVSMIGSAAELTASIRGDDRHMAMSRLDTEISILRDAIGAQEHSKLLTRRNMLSLQFEHKRATTKMEELSPAMTRIEQADAADVLLDAPGFKGTLNGAAASFFEGFVKDAPRKDNRVEGFRVFGFEAELEDHPTSGGPKTFLNVKVADGRTALFDLSEYNTTQGLFTGIHSKMRSYKREYQHAQTALNAANTKLEVMDQGASSAGITGSRLFEIIQSRDALEIDINKSPDAVWKRDGGQEYSVDAILDKSRELIPKNSRLPGEFNKAVLDAVPNLLLSHATALCYSREVPEATVAAAEFVKKRLNGNTKDEVPSDFSGWSARDYQVFDERMDKLLVLPRGNSWGSTLRSTDPKIKEICEEGILTVSLAVEQHEAARGARLSDAALEATLVGASAGAAEPEKKGKSKKGRTL